MIERLQAIDTDTIEDLGKLKEERKALTERLERLDAERESVSETVFDRVHREYLENQRGLEEKAAPLKERARQEFARLTELLAEAETARTEAELEREELELRHRIGEFDDDTFTGRRKEIDSVLTDRNQEVESIEEVRRRFVAAFDSEEELEAPVEEEAGKEIASFPTPPAEGEQDEEADGEVPPPPPGPPEVEGNLPAPLGATVLISSDAVPEEGSVEIGGTYIVRQARLVPVEPISGGSEFSIEPLTTIGRTGQNQIQVDEPAVSREHAEIRLTEKGYRLKDLGSENGTFVNGEVITEVDLADGDRVRIGTVQFVFHSPNVEE